MAKSSRRKTPASPIKTVVCGTDLSSFSKDALAVAAELAQAYDAKLIVVHAIQSWDSRYDFLVDDITLKLTQDAKAQLAQELDHLGKKESVPVEVLVQKGEPLKVILDAATKHDAGLVVVGKKGLTDDEDEEMGSVPKHLVQLSPVSVLIVKPNPPRNIKRIVCAMDFSPCSKSGLDWAIDLARREKVSEIFVFNSFKVPRGYLEAGMTYEVACERMRVIHQKDADLMLERRKTAHIEIKPVIEEGPTAKSIVQFAKKEKADLIVIGTRGRSRMTAFLVGGTAIKVLSLAETSVLAVKSKKHYLTLLAALERL